MITVSTTSPAEAQFVTHVLRDGLPAGVGWSVYLNGTLHDERSGQPADTEWPSQEERRLWEHEPGLRSTGARRCR